MFKPVLSSVFYIIRTVGLGMFGATSIVIIAMPLFNSERSQGVFGLIVGVWALATVVLSWPRVPDAWRKDLPTQKQLAFAESLEIDVPPGISKGELSDMISQVTGR